jgi:hypothetical protein
VLVGIHELEKSIVERFSVLKAISMEDIDAVDVIAIPAAVVVVDICMMGKMIRPMSCIDFLTEDIKAGYFCRSKYKETRRTQRL